MKLKDTFKAGVLASQLKAGWLNAVAWCLNTIHGGTHIDVSKPAKPGEGNGISVDLDMDGLCTDLRNRGFMTKTTTEDGTTANGGTTGNLMAFGESGEAVDSGQPKPSSNCGFVQAGVNSLPTGNLVKAGTGDLIVDTGISADDVPTIASGGTADRFVKINKDGELTTPDEQPISVDLSTAPTADKAVVIPAGKTQPVLKSAGAVVQPTSTSNITTGAAVQANRARLTDGGHTFGAADAAGVVVYLACRAVNDGANGSLFFRPFTLTSDGRIYAIGGESTSQFTFITS